jgi:hypothetical protein
LSFTRTFDYTEGMSGDSECEDRAVGDGGTNGSDSGQQAILVRLDEIADSIEAFQEQVNKQFNWLRTDVDNLRRYVKTLNQRMHDVEDDLLSRPTPAPVGLSAATSLPPPTPER